MPSKLIFDLFAIFYSILVMVEVLGNDKTNLFENVLQQLSELQNYNYSTI